MADPNQTPDDEPEIADASLLFGGEVEEAKPALAPTSSDSGDGYAIEGIEPEPEPAEPPKPAWGPSPRAARAVEFDADDKPKKSTKPKAPASSGVDQVWSRWAEWGGSFLWFGLGLMGAGFLLYVTFNPADLLLWFGVWVVSIVGLGVLAYPLLITLERPVRMTPEQALKDYFSAFSHLVPHTKRMWLLLAVDGRKGPTYSDFNGFKSYWSNLVNTWKGELRGKGFMNPFDIQLVEFKAEKSAGMTEIDVKYSARVIMRGDANKVIQVYAGSIRAVRGPDKMWYLDANPIG